MRALGSPMRGGEMGAAAPVGEAGSLNWDMISSDTSYLGSGRDAPSAPGGVERHPESSAARRFAASTAASMSFLNPLSPIRMVSAAAVVPPGEGTSSRNLETP